MRALFGRSFSYSFFFHIAIALIFLVSLADSINSITPAASTATEIRDNNKEIVNAVAISENELSQEIRSQQAADAAAKARAANEARQLAAAKAQALAQIQQAKQQQAALALQQQADAKKAADQLAQLQTQQKQAAQQLANTQAQAVAAKKTADATALAAKKTADAQKVANAKRLAAQQQAGAAVDNTQTQNEINRYVGLITQAIQVQWTQLPGVEQQKLSTTMIIRLAPDGTVLQVQNVGSSGNPALDRLALTAVYKASPLPVPTDPKLFANFRELKVKFSDS